MGRTLCHQDILMSYMPDVIDLDNYQIPVLARCPQCGGEIIEAGHWRRASEDEREDMLADGFTRAKPGGVCVDCEPVQRFTPEMRRRQGLRGDTLRVYRELTAKGMTTQQIADQIGVKQGSLNRVLRRQREKENS